MTPQEEKQQPPGAESPKIDLEALAEILVQVIRRELLLENERLGK